MKPYYERDGITIWNCDCREVLPTLAPGSIDAVITSPPYNLGGEPWPHLGNWKPGDAAGGRSKWRNGSDAGNGIQYAEHEDSVPWDEYVKWQRDLLSCLFELLPGDGAIFYNHKPRVIGAKLWTPMELIPPSVAIRQIIIWARAGGVNFNPTAFMPTHEWVMVLARDLFRLKSKAVSGLGDVWNIPQEIGTPHPAPFPVALPARILEAIKARKILDPFGGWMTTGVAAWEASRECILCEISEEYCELGAKRLDRVISQGRLFRPEPVKETQRSMFGDDP